MSSGRATFTVQYKAYLKLLLHASKHPHASVNGVLLGRQDPSSGQNWIVCDAIPLLHRWTNLSPMMEVGLDLASIHAKNENLKIVGIYIAQENIQDQSIGPVGHHILGKLAESFPSAFAFLVDVTRISKGEPSIQISMLQSSGDSKPPTEGVFKFEDPSISDRALAAVQSGKKVAQLADFDDHFEDAKVDWLRNEGIDAD
ncbi:hypothetical protein FRC03_002667 [Tulasnella sp. 419]|nr:hypothetical protein FRC03_002667 [Tulasnella sp. 419]